MLQEKNELKYFDKKTPKKKKKANTKQIKNSNVLLWTRLKEIKKTVKTLREVRMDFPGGPVAKTPCSWCREPGFNPRSGNYPHMPQLRPCTVKLVFLKKKKPKGHKTEKELWNKMANYATEKDSSQFQEK